MVDEPSACVLSFKSNSVAGYPNMSFRGFYPELLDAGRGLEVCTILWAGFTGKWH